MACMTGMMARLTWQLVGNWRHYCEKGPPKDPKDTCRSQIVHIQREASRIGLAFQPSGGVSFFDWLDFRRVVFLHRRRISCHGYFLCLAVLNQPLQFKLDRLPGDKIDTTLTVDAINSIRINKVLLFGELAKTFWCICGRSNTHSCLSS